jgi:hypothetical protein
MALSLLKRLNPLMAANGILPKNIGVSPIQIGLLKKILKVFGDEDIHLDPTLKTTASKARKAPSPLAGEGRGER